MQCGATWAVAREFVAASPGQVTRRSNTFDVSSKGPKRVKMMATRNGVCFLQRVSGNMDGSPEYVRIRPAFDESGVETWFLEADAGGGSAYGSAICVGYDQHFVDSGPT